MRAASVEQHLILGLAGCREHLFGLRGRARKHPRVEMGIAPEFARLPFPLTPSTWEKLFFFFNEKAKLSAFAQCVIQNLKSSHLRYPLPNTPSSPQKKLAKKNRRETISTFLFGNGTLWLFIKGLAFPRST